MLCSESEDLPLFQSFEALEARYFRRVNRHRISHIQSASYIRTRDLNLVVQCLACVNYFTGDMRI